MSKHQKEVRRERMKAERLRRRRPVAATHGAAALAAAAAIAAGTQAYATPVRFDNPAGDGHWNWAAPLGQEDNWLDFTQDAASQPGAADGPSSLMHNVYDSPGYSFGNVLRVNNSVDVEVDRSSGLGLLIGLNALDPIPSGATFNFYGYTVYESAGAVAFEEGVQKYLGVRFDQGVGWQYGWIGVVRTGVQLDAFAWGYETTPGEPIPAGAPEPGTLALLALGALSVAGRRRA